MARETHKVIDSKLREHFSQPVPIPAVLREGSSSSSSGKNNNTNKNSGDTSTKKSASSEEIELTERRR